MHVPMMRAMRLMVGASLLTMGCMSLTPEESCTAICGKMQSCGVSISGSTLTAGASCQSDCLSKITTRGAACKSSAAYLGDCFQTYTCSGIQVQCSTDAQSFS